MRSRPEYIEAEARKANELQRKQEQEQQQAAAVDAAAAAAKASARIQRRQVCLCTIVCGCEFGCMGVRVCGRICILSV